MIEQDMQQVWSDLYKTHYVKITKIHSPLSLLRGRTTGPPTGPYGRDLVCGIDQIHPSREVSMQYEKWLQKCTSLRAATFFNKEAIALKASGALG